MDTLEWLLTCFIEGLCITSTIFSDISFHQTWQTYLHKYKQKTLNPSYLESMGVTYTENSVLCIGFIQMIRSPKTENNYATT